MSAPRTLGVVLAGGLSRRMGRDKAFLDDGGKSFLERATGALAVATGGQVVISVARPIELHRVLGLPLIPDDPDLGDHGPIAGVISTLRWAATTGEFDRIATTSVDMPRLSGQAVECMLRQALCGGLAVASLRGETLPPLAVWPVSAIVAVGNLTLGHGLRSLSAIQSKLCARLVPLDKFGAEEFVNVNTPEDYAALSCATSAPSQSRQAGS